MFVGHRSGSEGKYIVVSVVKFPTFRPRQAREQPILCLRRAFSAAC
jgi:hypothetical protein